MSEILDQEPMEKKKGNRTTWVVIAVIGAFLVLCLVAIVILVLTLDPWGIVSRLRGGYDPIAQAAPPETSLTLRNLLGPLGEPFLSLGRGDTSGAFDRRTGADVTHSASGMGKPYPL